MLLPVSRLESVEDCSQRMLDEDDPWMGAATSFSVLDRDRRHIRWDQLPEPVVVPKALDFAWQIIGDATLLEIRFGQTVNPGELLGIYVKIKIGDLLVREGAFDLNFQTAYFGHLNQRSVSTSLIKPEKEVPCRLWYEGNPSLSRVPGGFDIIVAHSQYLRVAASPAFTVVDGTLSYDSDGNRLRRPGRNHCWRLRHLFPDRVQNLDPDVTSKNPIGLRADFEIRPTWPMFALGLLATLLLSIVLPRVVFPWLMSFFGGR